MKLFQNERQISLLHAINEELLKHRDNLQRALDGKSAFYMPNSDQRAEIEVEQARISSMLVGVSAMRRFWRLGPIDHGQLDLSNDDYTALRLGASLAYMQTTHCQLENAHPTYSDVEKQGLLDLFLYFDCKLDAANLENAAYYTYDTLQTRVGYNEHARSEKNQAAQPTRK